ncbi:MAG: cytochrome c biogenesis protein CcsA, partial [Candidatus Fonsibacter sp.]
MTGSLWGYPTWGTFWSWDGRLTSMFILVLSYILYVSLWSLIKNYNLAEKITNIIGIVGLINIPIIKFSVVWWNTLHQPASITLTAAPT